MSKENNTAGDGKQEEEFTIIEVDDSGVPVNQPKGEAAGHDSEDDDDIADEERDEGHDDHDDDQRLGHAEGEQDEETLEQRRERRKRDRTSKRVRYQTLARAKDRLIENQGRMLLNLQEQVAQLQGRTVQYDVNLLATQLTQVRNQQAEAKDVLAKLSKAGDHEGIAEIVELQMNLRDQHRTLEEQLRRAKSRQENPDHVEGPRQPAPRKPAAGAPPSVDPEVMRRAYEWAGKHTWANPKAADPEEMAIVRVVDQRLVSEGWDPATDEYWAELTSRVRRRLPHHFKAPRNGGADNGGQKVNGGNKSASGGPRMAPASQSGGSSRPLGKNEVRISRERKEAMQAAGAWDDPVKRNRMLASYAKYDRDNAA